MRTIKFRIWNGMEMVYDITSGKFGTFYVNPEKGDGLNPEDTASLTVNTTKYHEGTPLMQFTGLLDKNGKEIFELDVIEEGLVYFDDEYLGFFVKGDFVEGEHKPLYDITLPEILGNKFDNPELLKD